MSNRTYLKSENGNYYFLDQRISRKQYQKIAYGNWSNLPHEVVLKKLNNKQKRENDKKSYQIVYEEVLATPLAQYSMGIALEKVSNDMIKLCKHNIAEARRLVRNNKGNV